MASVSSEATESAAVVLPKDEEVLRMRRAPISAPALSTSDAPPTSSRAMRELSVVTVSDSEEAGGGATKGKERRRIGAGRKVEDETAGAPSNDTEQAPDMLVVYSPAGKTFVALKTIEDDMDADPMDELPAPPLPHIEPGDQRALEDLSAFFPFIFPHDFRAEQLFEEMIYDRRRRVLLLLLPIDLLFIALTRCTGCSVVPWAAMLLFDLFGCVALIRESRLLMSIFVATQCLLATPYIALTNENPALLLFHMVVLLLVVQLRFTMPHSRDQVRAEADDAPEEADEEAARDR